MKISLSTITQNNQKVIRFLIIAIIVVAALFVFLVRTGDDGISLEKSDTSAQEQLSDGSSDEQDQETSSDVVICDVSGAVKSPKVVELKKGSRISDAIDAAGGLTKNADITNVNRAAKVNDGDKILIPKAGDPQNDAQLSSGQSAQSDPDSGSQNANNLNSGKISLNSADSNALQQISGVGPVTAEKIIAYREQSGGFTKIEQLKDISGIGDKTFEKMKDQVTI